MADIEIVLHLQDLGTGEVPALPRVKWNDIGLLADAGTSHQD